MAKTFVAVKSTTWRGMLVSVGKLQTATTSEQELALTDHPCWKCKGGTTLIKNKPVTPAP